MTPALMRLSKFISWAALCGAVALFTTVASAQQSAQVPGRIIVVKVQGTVTATDLDTHKQVTLTDNAKISQHYVVTTASGSSVILVFSNGATLNLGSETSLAIDEYLQDPFADQVVVGNIKEEPTTSTTKLNLTRGELVGNVKHLHQDQGSSFTVNTPVGAAGIRGTTFRIVFQPDANGQWSFTLSTADGEVLFQGTVAAGSVPVGAGTEISIKVNVKVDPVTGEITVTSAPKITGVQNISAEDLAKINAMLQDALEQSSPVILNAAGPGNGNGGSNNPQGTPNPTTPSSDTTPLSGT